MKYLRKKDDVCYQLGSMQARAFEKSSNERIPSYFFIQQFMFSKEAKMMDDLSFLQSGLSELEIYINIKKQTKRKKGNVYSPEIMHWIGFFYRYASYLTGINSKILFKKITPNQLCDLYPLYHGLDIQKAIDMVFSNIDLGNEKPMDRFINLYKDKMISL